MSLPVSKRVQSQVQVREFNNRLPVDGEGLPLDLVVKLRWDDCCGNGRNSFGVQVAGYNAGVAKIDRNAHFQGSALKEICRYIPELAHITKWHMMDADGPMHYTANTIYHASEIKKHQHFVYLSDEVLKNQRVLLGLFDDEGLQAVRKRFEDFDLEVATSLTPDSKDADIEAARRTAIWPEASLEELRDAEKLNARLPALMAEFKRDIEALGFTY